MTARSNPLRTYAAVTPARDERPFLPTVLESLASQSVRPLAWIVVDNGSTDGTVEYVRELAGEHPWVFLRQSPPGNRYDRGGAYVRAFNAGVSALPKQPDVLVKLDADVSLDPDFMERILASFREDSTLGITSGSCWEQGSDGRWRERPILEDHVWGPTRCYRWPEMEAIFPLDESLGHARVDEVKAQMRGWSTGTQRDIPFRHHRPEGSDEASSFRAWRSEGEAAYYLGYRPTYLLARALYRMRRDFAAAGMVAGYVDAAFRRTPRCQDREVRHVIREHQRLRALPRRAYLRLRNPD